jgi:UDP-glucose 4-epimerase
MRILVTGGSGFIGSALVGSFIEQGHQVRVLDNGTRGDLRRLEKYDSHFEYVEADVRDSRKVDKALSRIETVFHLAYINGTENFYRRPIDILDVAFDGIRNILNSPSRGSVNQVYLASSSEVYQNPGVFPTPTKIPLIIPDVTNPRYSYGLGKMVQEFMLVHSRDTDIKKIIFRPHNIYGPDMGTLHVIPELFDKVLKATDGKLVLKGDGSHTRTFCYISDFVDAINLIMSKTSDDEILNVGTREEVSIRELAFKILHELDVDLRLEFSDTPLGETSRRVPDINRIQELGFAQKVPLAIGLQRYSSWFRMKEF